MIALVTGASVGIGHAFAEVLAEDGFDLVLVARDAQRLEQVAQELRTRTGVQVSVLAADLATDEGCGVVMERLGDADHPVDLLVNNAGFGLNQGFLDGDLAAEERLLDVLVRATLRLTHAALPGMVERGRGWVVNVSSVAGFLPAGTYAAAKAWVTTFTEGLSGELSGTGVTATAVCPGFTRTEFHARADMQMGALPDWAWLDARRVARDGVAAARAGRAVTVPSKRYHALVLAAQYTPRPLLRQATRLVPQTRRSGA